MHRRPAADHHDGWTRVWVRAGADRIDLAVDALWGAGAAGIEERDEPGGQLLVGGFAQPEPAAAAEADLRARGFDQLGTEPVDDTGLDAWRDHARPVAAGPLWLVPAWVDAPNDADPDQVLRLEPGRTFGSGSHPTTQLVVELLARLVRPGDRVIDVGCGSGVLAVAAARLGARQVVGIDLDPACGPVLHANAERNGHGDRVRWSDLTLAELAAAGERAEVVAANLLAPVIADHAEELRSLMAPGATLVVSGLLEDRWEATAASLAPLEPSAAVHRDGWTAVALAGDPRPER